ncbi:TrkH family potassium uptake protein [Desulfuromonas carbonis]|uniref:TrkH family potassium uptake protein n=1 Tax=Desulfuromonas sp. DDH964 TaxID=1823759 RepID=UPI00078D037B|nr:potassium transporter TrkG [Desulfuromonas sp. DDH964]AMV70945.1 Trk system potassium uptake protein TrkG [Desulfuromonas sp. DDH964]
MSDPRYARFLRGRYRILLGYVGLIDVLVGGLILSPCLLLGAFPGELAVAWGLAAPGLMLIAIGGALWRVCLPRGGESLTLQEGAVVVLLAWISAVVIGALPFMAVGGLNFTQAVFESTSGWTTTGLSVVDVTAAPRLLLLYRSVMQLAGGAGLAVIMLSALAGPAGTGLSAAEGRADQLVPNVRRSAKLVVTIYSGYVLCGWLALMLSGMGWFDAINHAFAAISTGGFSTRPESIGYWDSPLVEGTTVVLMLLGTMNFVTSYALLHGKFRAVGRNGEIRLQALLLPTLALVVLFGVTSGLYPTLGKQLRVAIFEVVTALSTTGFSTVGYGDWNGLGWLVLIVLMLIGGGTGSTAGGLKQYRVYALYRALLWEGKRMLLPRGAVTMPDVWVGDTPRFLGDGELRQLATFAFLYLATLAGGTGVLTAYGYSLKESLFEFASALGTVGLSVGVTSATAPAGLLWTETLGMILGRLEFFVIFIGLSRLVANVAAMMGSAHKGE